MKKSVKALRILLPALMAVQLGFSFGVYGPVRSGASMWGIAQSHAVKGVNINTMIKAIVRLNPQAFSGDRAADLRVGAHLVIPTTRAEVDQALSGRVSQADLRAARPFGERAPSAAQSTASAATPAQSSPSYQMSGSAANGTSSTMSMTSPNTTAGVASTSGSSVASQAGQTSMGADTDQVSASSQVQTVTAGAVAPSSDVAAMPMSTDVATLQQQLTAANTQIQTLTQKMATMSAQAANTESASSGSHTFWVWFWFVLFVLSAGSLGVLWSKKAKEGDSTNFFDRMTGSEKKNSER